MRFFDVEGLLKLDTAVRSFHYYFLSRFTDVYHTFLPTYFPTCTYLRLPSYLLSYVYLPTYAYLPTYFPTST